MNRNVNKYLIRRMSDTRPLGKGHLGVSTHRLRTTAQRPPTLGSHWAWTRSGGNPQNMGSHFPEMRQSSHQVPPRDQPLGLSCTLLSSHHRRVAPWDQSLSRNPSTVSSLKKLHLAGCLVTYQTVPVMTQGFPLSLTASEAVLGLAWDEARARDSPGVRLQDL